jgi:multiple sugar transport system permease protein
LEEINMAIEPGTYSLRRKNITFALLIILPAFVIAATIMYFPIFNAMIMSFKKVYFGASKFKWVGFKNFKLVIQDGSFLKSFWWTFIYGVSSTALLLFVGMYFALLLNRKMPGRNLIRGLLLMPWAIPVFVNAFLWLWLLNVQFGLVNYILMLLRIIKEPLHWTGGKHISRLSVLIAYIWRVFPFNMIVYLAAFQTIDPVYYEASQIDGATKIKQFIHVTVPQIRNIITFTALLNFIWAFQEFTTIWIMTRGGPADATNTLMTQVYTQSFINRHFGEAAATGVLWVIFLIGFTIIYLRALFFKRESYD